MRISTRGWVQSAPKPVVEIPTKMTNTKTGEVRDLDTMVLDRDLEDERMLMDRAWSTYSKDTLRILNKESVLKEPEIKFVEVTENVPVSPELMKTLSLEQLRTMYYNGGGERSVEIIKKKAKLIQLIEDLNETKEKETNWA